MSVSSKKISFVLIFLNIVLYQFFWNSLPMIFNATESDFQNFRTNWTNFRTLSEFQDTF